LEENAMIAWQSAVIATDFYAVAVAIISKGAGILSNWRATAAIAPAKAAIAVPNTVDGLGENPQFTAIWHVGPDGCFISSGMIKLITGYSEYSADDLWHLGSTVAGNLPNLPIFSTLKPTPVDIDTEATALESAINMYGPGRKQAIDTAFAALAGSLGEIAVNAPQVTGVTDMQLAEIGLPVVKTPQRATQPPPSPQNLRLFHGASPGDITGKCDSLGDKIRVYEAQWTLDPNGDTWSNPETFPNSRSFKYSGLARGKDTWVRVRARNAVGAGAWSDPATIMVT
jgi:hypothetical protein